MPRKPSPPKDTDSAWANLVGLAAYGLFRRMQDIMATADRHGYLVQHGRPLGTAELARIVGESPGQVRRLVERLVDAGRIEERDGMLCCPRMVHDAGVSEIRRTAGRLGAEQTKRQRAGQMVEQTPRQTGTDAMANGTDAPANAVASAGGGSRGKALTHGNGALVSSATAASYAREPQPRWVPDDMGTALLDALPSDEDRALCTYLLERVPFAPAWVAEFRQLLDPEQAIHGKTVTAAQLALAVRHYVGNGECEPPKVANLLYFGAYLRKAALGNLSPQAPSKYGPRVTARPTAAYDTSGNEDALRRLDSSSKGS